MGGRNGKPLSLDSVCMKLERTNVHSDLLNRLTALLNRLTAKAVSPDGYITVPETRDGGRKYIDRAADAPKVDPSWGAIVGDWAPICDQLSTIWRFSL